jgi:ABC-type multidrug transport system fused ATPase/permease subunit
LLRAHPIETGKIFIDGTVDVGQIDPKAVRSIFGLVTQSPFIFSGTVRENICVDKEYPDHAIIAILHKAGLGKFSV